MFKDRTLVGLNAAVFLMMLGVGMIVALLPQRVMDLSGSDAMVGFLASSFALSYIILQVPVGRLSDKIGFKNLLVAGYLLCCLTGVLFYLAPSSHVILLGRLVQGAGEAPVWALAPALLSIKYSLSKGRVMGIYNAAIHLGLTAGPLAGVLLAKRWTGNQAFLFYSAVCLLGAIVLFIAVEDTRQDTARQENILDMRGIKKLASREGIIPVLLGITLYGGGYGIFLTIIPAFLINAKSFSPAQIGFFFALFYIAISISQLTTGPLSDRYGRQIFMIGGLGLAALGVAVFPLLRQPWISGVLAAASLGLGVFYLSSMAFLNEVAPVSLKGTVSGAYYLFWGMGMFAGPVIIGRLGAWFAAYSGFLAFGLLLFLNAVFLASSLAKSRKQLPGSPLTPD